MVVHTLAFLQTTPYPTGYFECDLCQEKGSGAVYHCSACHFDLHPACIATADELSHFSHFEHPLRLAQLTSKTHTCDGCGDGAFPWVYRCSPCDFDMHAHCSRAPRFLQHRSHKHVLSLVPKAEVYPGGCWCDGCGKEASRLVYHCGACKFDLHISCAMLPRNPLHPKHPEHRLRLLNQPTDRRMQVVCAECGSEATKWIYACRGCEFYLHAQCAKLPRHEVAVAAAAPLPGSPSPGDVDQALLKMMDKLMVSEGGGASSATSPGDAEAIVRRLRKLLETRQQQQQHQQQQLQQCGPISRPITAATDDQGEETCPTCLEGYDLQNPKKILRCGHHLHTRCILQWMEIKSSCPVCRQQVILVDETS